MGYCIIRHFLDFYLISRFQRNRHFNGFYFRVRDGDEKINFFRHRRKNYFFVIKLYCNNTTCYFYVLTRSIIAVNGYHIHKFFRRDNTHTVRFSTNDVSEISTAYITQTFRGNSISRLRRRRENRENEITRIN